MKRPPRGDEKQSGGWRVKRGRSPNSGRIDSDSTIRPVPIDRGYHNLAIALRTVGEDDADDRIAAAIDHLAQAKWILEQEDEFNEQ